MCCHCCHFMSFPKGWDLGWSHVDFSVHKLAHKFRHCQLWQLWIAMAAMDFGSLWFSKTSKISKIWRVTLGAQACCCKMLQSHKTHRCRLRTRLSALSELSKTCRGAVVDRGSYWNSIGMETTRKTTRKPTSKTTRNLDGLGGLRLIFIHFRFSLDEVCHVHIPCSSPSPHGEENGLRDGQIHLSQVIVTV